MKDTTILGGSGSVNSADINNLINSNIPYTVVLWSWSRSRKELKLLAGAGAGAGIRSFGSGSRLWVRIK
jgi:hypothetical protein